MKKKYLILTCILFVLSSLNLNAQVTIPIYSDVLFYDGYAGIVSNPTAPDVVRLRNDLFTKKLTPAILAQVGTTLSLSISISAACDNYDRIGNINLALVPKGATSYDPSTTERLELGRFITPFMNKNVAPNLVPYTFSVDNVAKILKDTNLNLQYDFWIEFELFGVPYAANTQIVGCAGRSDVFFGTLNFLTNVNATTTNNTFLLPLNFKKNLNNYEVGASDALGTTVRTINFNVPSTITNSKFYYITSNHGSNNGGEEYIRRTHQIFYDSSSNPSATYIPGETTCEPYRIYNTQGNGIYGSSPMTAADWQSFSNWCPGAVIPIRTLNTSIIPGGNHFFRIAVPTAQFVDGQGYFPVSIYLQGNKTVLDTQDFNTTIIDFYPNPTKDFINIKSNQNIKSFELFDMQGRLLTSNAIENTEFRSNVSGFPKGVYILKLNFDNESSTQRIIKE